MEQQTPNRTCPACGSADYAFRNRKKITPKPGGDGEELMETKYRCKSCEHEWKVRVPSPKGGAA
jgi:transposase-like protein